MSTLKPQTIKGNLVKLSVNSSISSLKDLRACWSNPKVHSLHSDYHTISNSFSHFKSAFLSKKKQSGQNKLEKNLFPSEISPSFVSMIGENGQLLMIRILKATDFLLSILWLLSLEPLNSPCISEYLAYLLRLMSQFGLETVLKSALFLFSLQDFKHSQVTVQYEWILKIIQETNSNVLNIKGKEALDFESIKLDNLKFLNLKGIILSVLKVFGGLDHSLFQEANQAFYNEMVKAKLGIHLQVKQQNIMRKDVPLVTMNRMLPLQPRGKSKLSLFFLGKICFELEELSQRKIVLKERIPLKFYQKKVNREEAKIRHRARGILRFLLLGTSRGADLAENLELKIQSYLTNVMGDFRFLNKPLKGPLDYEFRLNFGLAEMKQFLGTVVNLRKIIGHLKQKWISQKTSNHAKKMIDTLELNCLLYTSPSPRDLSTSRMPSSA